MSMNEYITKFTQLSRYAPHEVYTNEKKQECFLNGLNDGLARDFENIQGMMNKVLVLENRRGVMERKCKLVHQHQLSSSSKPELLRPQLDLRSVLLSHCFSQGRKQLDKDSLSCRTR
jgi:hypothetical protein